MMLWSLISMMRDDRRAILIDRRRITFDINIDKGKVCAMIGPIFFFFFSMNILYSWVFILIYWSISNFLYSVWYCLALDSIRALVKFHLIK